MARPENSPQPFRVRIWINGYHNPMLAITVDNSFLFCRFTRMLFLPLLFQRRCLAHIIAKSYPIQTVIQLSISKQKEPIHRDIKNRREHCSRFKMMKLCIGSVNSETIYLLINHSASRFAFMSGAALSARRWFFHFEFHFLFNWCAVKEHIYYTRNLAGNQDFSSEVLHSF